MLLRPLYRFWGHSSSKKMNEGEFLREYSYCLLYFSAPRSMQAAVYHWFLTCLASAIFLWHKSQRHGTTLFIWRRSFFALLQSFSPEGFQYFRTYWSRRFPTFSLFFRLPSPSFLPSILLFLKEVSTGEAKAHSSQAWMISLLSLQALPLDETLSSPEG